MSGTQIKLSPTTVYDMADERLQSPHLDHSTRERVSTLRAITGILIDAYPSVDVILLSVEDFEILHWKRTE